MTKKRKLLSISLIIIIILLGTFLIISGVKVSKNTEKLVNEAYAVKGNYELFQSNLSKYDFDVIAAASIGSTEKINDDFIWQYDIDYIHTIPWGFGAVTYVSDTCEILYPDGTVYGGYSNRHIRLKWSVKNGRYEVTDVYEYVKPDIICFIFDIIS